MLVSYNWLKEYVRIPWSAHDLAERLTSSSFPVDKVENLGEKWQHIKVGEIRKIEKHPQASSLLICDVSLGDETVRILCGASNIKIKDKIPVALAGTVLPNGKRIEKSIIHGVESGGMLCSEAELELGTDTAGIMILDSGRKVGESLTGALKLADWIIELDLTPNRPDCLSVYGVAREISALAGKPLKKINFRLKEGKEKTKDFVKIVIEKPGDCPRYAARIIRNVKVGPSPAWLARRLYAVGQRPINNIVDITNLVMLELGQPLHAFDYDAFAEKKVLVRRAKPAEEFVTLDGVKRQLTSEILLITDGQKPIALAGIMGGQKSEVSEKTRNVLLESAYFNPQVIRFGRKELGLQTEASARFEKGADPNLVALAADRATALISELAGGEVLRGVADNYPRPIKPCAVVVRPEKVNQILETDLPAPRMAKILKSLGFTVTGVGKFRVLVPTFRPDVTLEADLIEEIARINGYDKIPTAYQNKGVLVVGESTQEKLFSEIRARLIGWGFQEIVTNSLVDPNLLELFGGPAPIKVLNPVTSDQSVLRTNLTLSMLQVILYNQNRKQPDLKLFEIGKAYHLANREPVESFRLCLTLTGNRDRRSWDAKAEMVDFYDLKGAFQALLESVSDCDLKLEPADTNLYSPPYGLNLNCGSGKLGQMGLIAREILNRLDIKNEVYLGEIDLEVLSALARPERVFQSLPKYPPVERDVAILVDRSAPAQAIVEKIRSWAGGLAEEVGLFDLYQGKQIPPDKKSLAFYIRFRSMEKTLTEEEVNRVQENIIAGLQREFNAQLRS